MQNFLKLWVSSPVLLGTTLLMATVGTGFTPGLATAAQPNSEVITEDSSQIAQTSFQLSRIVQKSENNLDSQQNSNILSVEKLAQADKKQVKSQVTSVSQLSDVQPTDWAFAALQSLVERYGCIAGYPNGTYRGNRALTRYEFAAGLNACLDRVNELIATATANLVSRGDLETLQRLQQEL